jgi:hypothetical protein
MNSLYPEIKITAYYLAYSLQKTRIFKLQLKNKSMYFQ